MGEVVNLNRFRKRKAREAELAEAERNRASHGRSKAEKTAAKRERDKEEHDHAGHERDREQGADPVEDETPSGEGALTEGRGSASEAPGEPEDGEPDRS